MQRDQLVAPDDAPLKELHHYSVKPTHGDEIFGGSLTETLQYVAANRAGLVPSGSQTVFREDWGANQVASFQQAYQQARIDWFWAAQGFIDQYQEWAVEQLDAALTRDPTESA